MPVILALANLAVCGPISVLIVLLLLLLLSCLSPVDNLVEFLIGEVQLYLSVGKLILETGCLVQELFILFICLLVSYHRIDLSVSIALAEDLVFGQLSFFIYFHPFFV